MRINKNKNQLLIILLAVGFLIGIIYENFIAKGNVILSDIFTRSNLERYMQTNVISKKYFWYVAKSRILLFMLIYVISFMPWKKLFVILCLLCGGAFCGMLSVSAILQLGIKGILLCVVGMLPQGIFYVLAYSILFLYWFQYPTSRWNRTKTLFAVLMFCVGVILEVYANPVLVKFIIKAL